MALKALAQLAFGAADREAGYPARRPCTLFLFVGSQLCAPASFPRSVVLPQLPSASICSTLTERRAVHIQGT